MPSLESSGGSEELCELETKSCSCKGCIDYCFALVSQTLLLTLVSLVCIPLLDESSHRARPAYARVAVIDYCFALVSQTLLLTLAFHIHLPLLDKSSHRARPAHARVVSTIVSPR